MRNGLTGIGHFRVVTIRDLVEARRDSHVRCCPFLKTIRLSVENFLLCTSSDECLRTLLTNTLSILNAIDMSINSTNFFFLPFLLCCTISQGAAGFASIEVIRRSTLDYVRAIHSIEYEVSETVTVDSAKNAERRLRYWQQGNMFRGESSFGDEDTWTSTYTGNRYQIFFKERDTMSLKNTSAVPNPTRIMGPPMLAFSWLAGSGMTFAWSDLTAEENINRLFSKAKYVDEEKIGSDSCTMLLFPGVVDGSTVTVWFSKEKSCFPIKHVLMIGRRNIAEVNVTSFETVLLDGGSPILIPTGVKGTNNHNTSKVMTTSIVPNSLKVNQKYDDDFFTLPTTLAKTVNDIDELEAAGLLETPYDIPSLMTTHKRPRLFIIIFNVIVIALIIYLLLKRRR